MGIISMKTGGSMGGEIRYYGALSVHDEVQGECKCGGEK